MWGQKYTVKCPRVPFKADKMFPVFKISLINYKASSGYHNKVKIFMGKNVDNNWFEVKIIEILVETKNDLLPEDMHKMFCETVSGYDYTMNNVQTLKCFCGVKRWNIFRMEIKLPNRTPFFWTTKHNRMIVQKFNSSNKRVCLCSREYLSKCTSLLKASVKLWVFH